MDGKVVADRSLRRREALCNDSTCGPLAAEGFIAVIFRTSIYSSSAWRMPQWPCVGEDVRVDIGELFEFEHTFDGRFAGVSRRRLDQGRHGG
jgi:hypothetical protein